MVDEVSIVAGEVETTVIQERGYGYVLPPPEIALPATLAITLQGFRRQQSAEDFTNCSLGIEANGALGFNFPTDPVYGEPVLLVDAVEVSPVEGGYDFSEIWALAAARAGLVSTDYEVRIGLALTDLANGMNIIFDGGGSGGNFNQWVQIQPTGVPLRVEWWGGAQGEFSETVLSFEFRKAATQAPVSSMNLTLRVEDPPPGDPTFNASYDVGFYSFPASDMVVTLQLDVDGNLYFSQQAGNSVPMEVVLDSVQQPTWNEDFQPGGSLTIPSGVAADGTLYTLAIGGIDGPPDAILEGFFEESGGAILFNAGQGTYWDGYTGTSSGVKDLLVEVRRTSDNAVVATTTLNLFFSEAAYEIGT